jgi:hypothetical protein
LIAIGSLVGFGYYGTLGLACGKVTY